MDHLAARFSKLFAAPLGESATYPWINLLMRSLSVVAIVVVSGFLVFQAGNLWREWKMLQLEIRESNLKAPVGFLNISPIASYAEAPREWFRDDGRQLFVWSRWEGGVGHRWFRFASGELEQSHLDRPSRLFISQAIDYPVVEINDGTIWKRIPSESMVVGYRLEGQKCAYPLGVLRKVEVINDVVEGHPYLIDANPFVPLNEGYSIYDAVLDGHRVTMTATGYFSEGNPILTDRGTDSFWFDREGALVAMAGKHKGKRLSRVAHPAPVTWSSWLSENGHCRLLVGADRTHGIPKE